MGATWPRACWYKAPTVAGRRSARSKTIHTTPCQLQPRHGPATLTVHACARSHAVALTTTHVSRRPGRHGSHWHSAHHAAAAPPCAVGCVRRRSFAAGRVRQRQPCRQLCSCAASPPAQLAALAAGRAAAAATSTARHTRAAACDAITCAASAAGTRDPGATSCPFGDAASDSPGAAAASGSTCTASDSGLRDAAAGTRCKPTSCAAHGHTTSSPTSCEHVDSPFHIRSAHACGRGGAGARRSAVRAGAPPCAPRAKASQPAGTHTCARARAYGLRECS